MIGRRIIVLIELIILDNHKRYGVLQEFLTGGSQLQKTVVLNVFLQITSNQCLTDNGIHQLVFHILTGTEEVVVLMLMGKDFFGLLANDKVDDIVGTEILLQSMDGIEHQHQHILGLLLGLRMQTVVAIMAVFLSILFTEIVQQHLPATDARLGIGSGLSQQLTTDILLGNGFALHELIEFLQVLLGVERDTHALTAVTTGTTRLLIVAFQRLGDIIMDNKTHIGLVDTHAKGDGGHNDVNLLHQEVVLGLRTEHRLQTGMIRSGLDVVGL